MDIFKLVGIGLTGAVLSLTIKQYKPELAVAVGMTTGILLFLYAADGLAQVFAYIREIMDKSGVEEKYFVVVMKIIGVAYVAQYGAELCRDCGENAVALKVELAGKVFILILTMPIIAAFLDVCIRAMNLI